MAWVPRVALLCAGFVVVASLPRVFTARTADTLRAMRVLGPVGGWRCASLATYVYDPRTEQPDGALVAELPETVLTEAHPEVVVERAEVSLRGSDAVLWTTLGQNHPPVTRVYVLSPASREAVGQPLDRPVTCYARQRGWTIVAEQNLQ